MDFIPYKKVKDQYGWRCMYNTCINYKNYESIRTGSFFSDMNILLLPCMRIITKFINKNLISEINNSVWDVSLRTISKFVDKLRRITPSRFWKRKTGWCR